ncbi:hypothetical protein MN116_009050 [Schistosoma mekongi]|uniref:Uncharacterized protein n=1 Tax=Schistosoma mekongi TaxID=38744 RepID=A0AAE2D111_SCHME|nr:hypothetical protein MN116_009050 [Schistosoma mekongi]
MIIVKDLTKYILPQGIFTSVCLFISTILAFILVHQNNHSVAFIICFVGSALAIFPTTIIVGQAVIKDGYINFRDKFAFSAFMFI